MFIKVEGSGDNYLDGIYVENGELNGKSRFLSSSDENQFIEWNNDRWELITSDGGDTIYYSPYNTLTPDLATTWYEEETGNIANISVSEMIYPEMTIKGAGVGIVNDCYVVYNVVNEIPEYARKSQHLIGDSVYINYMNDDEEGLFIHGVPSVEGGTVPMFYATEDFETRLDLIDSWTVDKDGIAPIPTITLDCISFTPSSSKARKRY